MDRRLAAGRIEAAAERFSIDGDDLPVGDVLECRDPTQQALLELRRFDRRQDGVEAIVRRDTISQVEKPRQPLAFLPAKLCDGDKIVGPANDRAHGDHHDVDQRISHLATARIGKLGEVILKSGGLGFGHSMYSWA